MAEIAAKVLVVGGGPGGYVSAIRAGQLGLDVVLVEQGGLDGGLGGTCLNVGCIPSKALIHAADAYERAAEQAKSAPFGLRVEHPTIDFARTIEWKNGIVGRLTSGVGALLKRHRVKILQGRAVMIDGKTCRVETDTGPQAVSAEHVVLATGSVPTTLPALPFGGRVLSSTEALSLSAIPERLAVVGAGYIGLELGTAFAKLGAKVTVIEAADRILPSYDEELVRPVARHLRTLGVEVLTRARAVGLSDAGDALRIEQEGAPGRSIPADKILVAAGRRARTTGFGLERLDLNMNGPFVQIDERCATSMRNVWAVGDLTGEPMLAHRAMAQGVVVAELIAGHRRVFDGAVISCRVFHRSGDRHRRPLARRGAQGRPRGAYRPVPVSGQWPGADLGRGGRLRARDSTRRQSPAPGRCRGRCRRIGTRRRLRSRARDGGEAGRHRRHHPCSPHPRRGLP